MEYIAPTRLDDALAARRAGASIVAGGTDWFPAKGEAPFSGTLLDITRIEGLRGITTDAAGIRIGAATTWSEVIRADLPSAFDGLKAAAREIGAVQIQNAGTVAGNLCNASPAADGIPPLLALDATVELAGPEGTRRLTLPDFVTGVRRTALEAGEIVTAIHVPTPEAAVRSAFVKLGARRYLVISIVMVAVQLSLRAGRVHDVRIAVGAASPVARRLQELEAALEGLALADLPVAITPDRIAGLAPIDDIRADAAYRREAVPEAIRRALQLAGGD
ncbi:FAD binding domain-containing protein [Roseivivax sediminis]|uniref:CO or xanthine dehydrogenase, FAD-binding subunit n=1 Tax=Roseivivax sediminis TaxID=936889 RepID=A0A1I2DXK3_9RHOB|nr:xanthine dehydrogenase family protein subunit M [Roseivivax sediminis]SFE84963.1 CO or xanthine dehydrogenase, FAD-binding subunit [Roseivivax sediminis]